MEENRLAEVLIEWYQTVKRDLPWRNTSDPYCIWISEIILQQTRVDQGHDYYVRFIDRFPNVASLAEADEDEVLKLWQGLGYYSRARNLHKAAQQIVDLHKGVFPSQYNQVRALKGVGDYTAAAICSFAFDLPYAVVDGNVYRVLSRLFNIDAPIDSTLGKKLFAELAQELLHKSNPATYNQAIMEFGALQCTPKNPQCTSCLLIDRCLAYDSNSVDSLPQKSKKVKVKSRFFNYIQIEYGEYTYLKKRSEKDIWRNLFEFPLIETSELLEFEELSKLKQFQDLFAGIESVEIEIKKREVVHILSHRKIITNFYKVTILNENRALSEYQRVATKDFHQYAVSQLITRILEE